jgi:succinate dehydrogenase / fumarate reductase membrane anchor subunit
MAISAAPRAQRRPRQNFETWAWLFMRVSGLVLFFLALIHMYIMHIENDVTHTTVSFVARRWSNPLWRLFDWLLLALGLLHGGNGLRTIVNDYVHRPITKVVTKSLLYGGSAALFALGTITILTFR